MCSPKVDLRFCAPSNLLSSVRFLNSGGNQREVRLGLGFAETDAVFNHTLDSKKLRSLSGEVRLCLAPRAFFPCLGLPICAAFVPGQQAGRLAAAELDGSAWACGLKPGTGFIQPWPEPFICTSCDTEGTASSLPWRDSEGFLGGVFWW